jgi:hypothetical protein
MLVRLVTPKKPVVEVFFVAIVPAEAGSRVIQCMLQGKGMVDVTGIEPATPCLQSRCSPS